MRVLVYGSLNIDLIFSVDHIVRPGETIGSFAFERGAGGKGENQAAALAKAGLPVYMAGKIGYDGDFLIGLLKTYNVNTDFVRHSSGSTGKALIQVDKNGQNSIVLHAGTNAEITMDEVNETLEAFSKGDIIVLQNEIPHVAEIISAAKERGLRVCFNPSPFDENTASYPLSLVDILILNEIEGAELLQAAPETHYSEILEGLIKQFPNAEIVLTAGKSGAFYGYKDIREKGDIVDLPVVDTTGAGDTFLGYFIAAKSKKLPIKETLILACTAASIAVSRKGAMPAIPFASEVF